MSRASVRSRTGAVVSTIPVNMAWHSSTKHPLEWGYAEGFERNPRCSEDPLNGRPTRIVRGRKDVPEVPCAAHQDPQEMLQGVLREILSIILDKTPLCRG